MPRRPTRSVRPRRSRGTRAPASVAGEAPAPLDGSEEGGASLEEGRQDAEVEPTEGELVEPDEVGDGEPASFDMGEHGEAELVDDAELERLARDGMAGERARAAEREAEHTRALVARDPLTAYIQQIRHIPLLTREEEHDLAVEYLKTRDPRIRTRLVASNLRLVVKLAHEYRRAYRNLLDLIQEGNVGLVQAVDKYDPFRGVKLSSYAAWWIRAYILKFILNNWRLVKIGTTQAQRKLFFNLKKERERLEAEGFEVGPKLLAERLEVSEAEVEEMESRLASSDLSLDAPISREDGEGRSHLDQVASPEGARPDVAMEGEEFQRLLRGKLEKFAGTLRGREATIFEDRLLSSEPLTLKEIGEKYDISRERARQLEKRLLDRLRRYLEEELGDAVNVALGIEEE